MTNTPKKVHFADVVHCKTVSAVPFTPKFKRRMSRSVSENELSWTEPIKGSNKRKLAEPVSPTPRVRLKMSTPANSESTTVAIQLDTPTVTNPPVSTPPPAPISLASEERAVLEQEIQRLISERDAAQIINRDLVAMLRNDNAHLEAQLQDAKSQLSLKEQSLLGAMQQIHCLHVVLHSVLPGFPPLPQHPFLMHGPGMLPNFMPPPCDVGAQVGLPAPEAPSVTPVLPQLKEDSVDPEDPQGILRGCIPMDLESETILSVAEETMAAPMTETLSPYHSSGAVLTPDTRSTSSPHLDEEMEKMSHSQAVSPEPDMVERGGSQEAEATMALGTDTEANAQSVEEHSSNNSGIKLLLLDALLDNASDSRSSCEDGIETRLFHSLTTTPEPQTDNKQVEPEEGVTIRTVDSVESQEAFEEPSIPPIAPTKAPVHLVDDIPANDTQTTSFDMDGLLSALLDDVYDNPQGTDLLVCTECTDAVCAWDIEQDDTENLIVLHCKQVHPLTFERLITARGNLANAEVM